MNPQAEFSEAVDALARGDHKSALALLGPLDAAHPGRPSVLINMAIAAAGSGQFAIFWEAVFGLIRVGQHQSAARLSVDLLSKANAQGLIPVEFSADSLKTLLDLLANENFVFTPQGLGEIIDHASRCDVPLLSFLRTHHRRNAEDLLALLQLLAELHRLENYEELLECEPIVQSLLVKNPSSGQLPAYFLAEAHYQLGMKTEAMALYAKVLEMPPADVAITGVAASRLLKYIGPDVIKTFAGVNQTLLTASVPGAVCLVDLVRRGALALSPLDILRAVPQEVANHPLFMIPVTLLCRTYGLYLAIEELELEKRATDLLLKCDDPLVRVLDAMWITANPRHVCRQIDKVTAADKKIFKTTEQITGNQKAKLRVGYLSSNFCQHPVGEHISPVLNSHDRSKLDVYLIAVATPSQDYLNAYKNKGFHILDISDLNDADAYKRLKDLDLDVAIDLNGDTAGARNSLFRRRIGRTQVCYLGFPAPVRSDVYDKNIVDKRIRLPREYRAQRYAEMIRLHNPYIPNPYEGQSMGSSTVESSGFKFVCVNNLAKISLSFMGLWTEILQQNEEATLTFVNTSPQSKQNLWEWFDRAGISSTRIFIHERIQKSEYLEVLHNSDLGLDSLPYSAHTTYFDALYAGLPVMTLTGDAPHQSLASAMNEYYGLGNELNASSESDYISKSLAHSMDRHGAASLRKTLTDRYLTMPYNAGLTRELESLYQAWGRHG